MIENLIRLIRPTPLYFPLRNLLHRRRRKKELADWQERGRPVPPPHAFKQEVLKEYATRYGLHILVETGTFKGDMVEAMRCCFHRIYSIELDNTLFQEARRRFRSASHIEILHGDSSIVLGDVVKKINMPCLFWLDGHYSAGETTKGENDTPIYAELAHILNGLGEDNVIIIDDARNFGSDPAYPTIEELKRFILTKAPAVAITVCDDCIRIVPKEGPHAADARC